MPITDLKNTKWKFPLTPVFTGQIDTGLTLEFVSANITFKRISLNSSYLRYHKHAYDNTPAYYIAQRQWYNDGYRIIEFTGGDTTNAELIAWIQANAVQIIPRHYVDDADLLSVADAIRAKTGSTEPLVFPQGFVDAINEL